jgi:hypothetical protein
LPLAVGPSKVITKGSGCVNNQAGVHPRMERRFRGL